MTPSRSFLAVFAVLVAVAPVTAWVASTRLAIADGETAIESGGAARARAVLDRGVAALGGRERLAAIETWTVEGRGRENLSAENQGLAPGRPTWRPHEERVAVDARTLAVAWERRTPRNDLSLRWRRFVWRADSSGFYDHNAGYGALRARPTPESRRRAMARRVPHLLVLDVASHATLLAWRGEVRLDGRVCDRVAAELPDGARIDLTFERDPAVLRELSYATHLPGSGDVVVSWRWPKWSADARLGFVPSGHVIRIGTATYQEVAYSRYGGDAGDAAAVLAIPADAPMGMAAPHATPAAPAGVAATGEVAPGVHVHTVGGFTVMFVEFPDYVVAVEAPESHPGLEAIPPSRDTTRLTAALLEEIARVVPGKPVRYAVVSHHHGDHMGGLRAFAAAGATLLVASGHRLAALAQLAAPHTLAPDTWSGDASRARVEAVTGRRVIAGGGRRLEVFNVGRNPHTEDNLFVWLPAESLLFQGDLFYYQTGDVFPPPGRATMNRFFAGWLRSHGLRPRAIYGVHNDGPAGPDALDASLR